MTARQSGSVAVIVNPSKVADLAVFRAEVTTQWPDARWLETTREDPGAGQAREAVAAGAELVMVCGGDGTVAACAGVLAGTDAVLAIIPAGTGNLLARNLGIPLDRSAAIALATSGNDRRIDVLESDSADGQRFAVMAGLGFDAALIRDTDDDLKAKLGWPAYLGGFVRAFRNSKRVRCEITIDSEPALVREAVGVLVGNVGQLQAGIALLPDARPDDGKLDVIVFAPATVTDWPVLIWRILRRRPTAGRQADALRGSRVSIVADRPMPMEFDGDFQGEASGLSVRVIPGALVVRCP